MPQRHRPELSDSVSGESLVTYRRIPRTFSPGRTCAVPGCPTVLSIYNSATHCAAHNAGKFRAPAVAVVSDTPSPPAPAVATGSTGEGAQSRPRARMLVDPGGEVGRRAS